MAATGEFEFDPHRVVCLDRRIDGFEGDGWLAGIIFFAANHHYHGYDQGHEYCGYQNGTGLDPHIMSFQWSGRILQVIFPGIDLSQARFHERDLIPATYQILSKRA